MPSVYGSGAPSMTGSSYTDTLPFTVKAAMICTNACSVTKIRYYVGNTLLGTESSSAVAYIWFDNTGTTAQKTFTPSASVGWQEVTLDTPFAVPANTPFAVGVYFTGSGTVHYAAAAPGGFPLANGSLSITGSAYSTTQSRGIPTTDIVGTASYFVDALIAGTASTTASYDSITSSTGWTATGGSLPAILSDASSSTYIRSSDNPVNVVFDGVLAPLATPPAGTGVTVTFKARRNAGTTGTIKADLYENTTLISTQTVNVTSSTFTDITVTFPATDVDDATTGAWAAGMRLVLTANAS